MIFPLEHWQNRLDRHFRSLAEIRDTSALPIFALEHGLTNHEVNQISILLRDHIAVGKDPQSYWLPWVVYATEIGYNYSGDEYWQSFEQKTPRWEFHHRNQLRDWFRKFQIMYHGVRPSGAWADQFPIIAWPITHAIVPKYLQYQFAAAFYQLRFRLAGLNTVDSFSVGQLLADHAHNVSTRFQKFLQQMELTGRIVLGLLDETPAIGQNPVDPAALERIIADLEAIRATRGWLKETRRTVRDRFKGIGRGSGPQTTPGDAAERARAPDYSIHPNIRPHVFLRYSGASKWSVAMEIPNFASVAGLNSGLRTFLRRIRCRLAGATDTKPAGWLLSNKNVGILKSWPDPQKPLVEFEQPNSTVDSLLHSDCTLSSGPIWLFHVGPDGRAREIRGNIVRPGCDYILITKEGFTPDHSLVSKCFVDCSGISSYWLSVSKKVSAEDTIWLQSVGLHIARTIRVWPAGLPCRSWDGEGQSEWLTTEEPCFGILHDHPVDAYVLRLNNGAETVIQAYSVGIPVFVRLPHLPAGTHSLTVRARRHTSIANVVPTPPPEGYVELKVREPEPWIPGVAAHAGLAVTLDPNDATLDEFWANKISLSVIGPESHSVTCTVSLETGSGDQILSEQIGCPIPLPLRPETWRKKFDDFVRRKESAWHYLEASGGRLRIKGDELGEYVISFERDVLPVRWITRNVQETIILRLLDDTGLEGSEAKCLFFSMDQPLIPEVPDTTDLLSGHEMKAPGGLFIAQHGTYNDAIVVSTGLTGEGFEGLGVNPDFSDIHTGSIPIAKALQLRERWNNARIVGFLAEYRRECITQGFLTAIIKKICGKTWADAESTFRNPDSTCTIDMLKRKIGKRGFSAVLKRDHAGIGDNPGSIARWYASLAARYGLSSDRELCEFAIRLGFEPDSLLGAFGSELDRLVNQACSIPELIRGARFLALLFMTNASSENSTRDRGIRWS